MLTGPDTAADEDAGAMVAEVRGRNAPNFRQEKATRESQKGKMGTPHLVTVHLPGIGMRPFHPAKKNMLVTRQSHGSASGGRSDCLLYIWFRPINHIVGSRDHVSICTWNGG